MKATYDSPRIYEISHFLTEEECDHLIGRAKQFKKVGGEGIEKRRGEGISLKRGWDKLEKWLEKFCKNPVDLTMCVRRITSSLSPLSVVMTPQRFSFFFFSFFFPTQKTKKLDKE